MKLAIISTITYPSTLANRIHLLEMTRAFAEHFASITLLCVAVAEAAFPQNVHITPLGKKRSLTSAWAYARFLRKHTHDVWFAREPHLLLFTTMLYIVTTWKLPPKIRYEIHDMPRDTLDGVTIRLLQLLRNVHIVVITNALKTDLQKKFKLTDDEVLVLPDGVNLENFSTLPTQASARATLQAGTDKPVVVYAGSLYPWKGVYTLLEAAKATPEIEYWYVGGSEADNTTLKQQVGNMANVRVWGHVPHAMVKNYLAAADALVLPNSANYKMSLSYTSPLKLFEYMAAGRVIIASDLPSIREIITDQQNGYLVAPDDAVALAKKITEVLSADTTSVVHQAQSDVRNYSWKKRVARIMNTL